MIKVYRVLFWVLAILLVWLTWYAFSLKDLSFVKDLGLPLAVLLFTVGGLWHKMEDQLFDQKKYSQERKDKYWDKRFDYYCELEQTVAEICKLSENDVVPEEAHNPNGRFSKIGSKLDKLINESVILFPDANINQDITALKEAGREIISALGNMASSNNQREKLEAVQEQLGVINKINSLVDNCRQKIFSYLKV